MRQPKPLSARTVRKHLAALPDWQAVDGNRELVTSFRPSDQLAVVLSGGAALILAQIWGGHARVERRGLDIEVCFTTPAAGGVTRNDLRLAALFSAAQPRLAPSGDWRTEIEASVGRRKHRQDLLDVVEVLRQALDLQSPASGPDILPGAGSQET